MSEYSPLLSFDPLGGLVPSPSTDQAAADSFAIYLKLFSLLLLALLTLLILGFLLFHHPTEHGVDISD